MRFGKTLRESVYPPWKDKYLDYGKLKRLLRDDEDAGSDADGDLDMGESAWTEDDEKRFCDEIFNGQLEKVAQFQQSQVQALRDRADAVFGKLKELTPRREEEPAKEATPSREEEPAKEATPSREEEPAKEATPSREEEPAKEATDGKPEGNDATTAAVRALEAELDSITNELRELKRYSSINYTGFLKIVKKHDRKRGNRYKVRPMMQVSLARRPFNSEAGYSPLLAKLSLMYDAVHQYLAPAGEGGAEAATAAGGGGGDGSRYTAHKFWVHPDNLLEVKTMILRHLPALVYSESSAKDADVTADPTLTSLYFDNRRFELYNQKLQEEGEKTAGAGAATTTAAEGAGAGAAAVSLRLRWYGQLAAKPELSLDEKVVSGDGTSAERRIAIKDKYVKPFLDGQYHMEKSVQKMERQGERAEAVAAFRATVASMQALVRDKQLEPLLRANYVRTAFQKPADDRVRVSIDTNLAFVREDNLDVRRPCRDAAEWHRRDMDAGNAVYPFAELPPSDVSRFPYAVLEIKLREEAAAAEGDGEAARKHPSWVADLMASHLVHAVPHFSKFVHGTAVLFDDYVNRLPFWLSELEGDIRRDPQQAFEEEEQRRAQRAADEQVVGSFLGTTQPGKFSASYKASKSSPAIKSASYLADRLAAETAIAQRAAQSEQQEEEQQQQRRGRPASDEATAGGGAGLGAGIGPKTSYGAISSVLPSFSMTRYAKWRRFQKNQQDEAEHSDRLPEGVTEPAVWIKNAGPLRIEPKVWLANERTFLKWQHICVLLGSLAVALFTAASSGQQHNAVAEAMGAVYVVVAAFAGFWGWFMLQTRREMIIARSGRDFDNMIGPVVVSVALMGALLLNLFFAYRSVFERAGSPVVLSQNASVHVMA